MARAKVEHNPGQSEIAASWQASPLALKVFLDTLAELIAEAILEETTQGRPRDVKNSSAAVAIPEAPQC